MKDYTLTVCTTQYQVLDDGAGGSTDIERDRYHQLVCRTHLADVATYLDDHGLIVPSSSPVPARRLAAPTPQRESARLVAVPAPPAPTTFPDREWCAVVTAVIARAWPR